ncbi:allose kinase [Acerihabitans arboris]|uniref:Allose kinase n=1 Tax=Acerihabitans arboris TaxID=2691583 RepID=A0A845SNB8_9GAMM|nr:allose kinase [Acerihabitans arboris]NDL62725.1 allose kinase [Acerihabitans arboris]
MSSRQRAIVGVDMGATHIRICLLSPGGEVLVTAKERTLPVVENGLAAGLSRFIGRFLQQYGAKAVAVMIGFPASIARDRKNIMSTPNLPCAAADFVDLAALLEQRLKCPVAFERDVNLQLFYDVAERNLGDKLVLGCYLGTGFGFSVWLNGAPYVGAHGVAGELGHIPLGDDGIRCGCGNPGCLETVCSGVALARWYHSAPRDYALSDVFSLAGQDDYLADFIDRAARAMATGINLFDPDVILLGGGVMDMVDFPLDRLIARAGDFIRKPLPFDEIKFARASSSAFNGAIGAARMGRRLAVPAAR